MMERPTVFIGIDPGGNGGLALLIDNYAEAIKMPSDLLDLRTWFSKIGKNSIACMELVTGYVGGYNREAKDGESAEDVGRRTTPGSHMFKLGKNVGRLEAMLHVSGISVDFVQATAWQRSVGMEQRPKGISSTKWKNMLKARAQELFPQLKVTKATADALLLAHHCKIKYGGER
jgi:hypothetical protein